MAKPQTTKQKGITPMNTQIQTSHEYSHARILKKTLLSLAVVLALTVGRVNAVIPMLNWTPETNGVYDYGTVPVGQTISQLFTLTNNGGSASAALTVSISGSPMFTVTSDACSATSLGPGRSCGVVVQFDATSSGQLTATLTANGRKELATASITLIGTGAARRHVYWTNSTYPGTIGRADSDGQNANQSFITGVSIPIGIAVNSTHIYWANFNTSSIGRADRDGQNVNQSFITGGANSSGVAIDGSHIYWANVNSGTIGRADLDGQNVNQNFITGLYFPNSVAVDGSHIYWANSLQGGRENTTIGRADLDGQNVNQSFITSARPYGVVVDGSHIYWANQPYWAYQPDDAIGRADLDGQNVNESFITGPSSPYGVAVDGSHVYWTNSNGTIGRADLDGQNVNQSFITGGSDAFAFGLAVDPE
jgi:streptogramin lyase